MALAQKQNTLYVMHAKLCQDEANVVANSHGELWHKRLNHMSERGMHILVEKDFLLKVKGIDLEKCVECLAGKHNRVVIHSRPLCVMWMPHYTVVVSTLLHLLMTSAESCGLSC